MKIAYFVHDLSDPAVAKRVWMLRQGGAEVALAGFRRTAAAVPDVSGVPAVDLGRTSDARLGERAGSVMKSLAASPAWGRWMAGAEAVMGRNLEMLLLASAARRLHAPGARLAYECLDVHRLMLGSGLASRALRRLEGALMDRSDLLIVSSPAFIDSYFEPLQRMSRRRATPMVVENKAFADDSPLPAPAAGRPWRIGWFGMIRCRRSLDALCALTARRPDLIQIEIRGRPAYTEFDDFDGQVARSPGVRFAGAYAPGDLPAMYAGVHFNWAIDWFQDEGNSRWLLPNRLYEGGRFGVPAIVRSDSETGRWHRSRDLGVVFDRPAEELEAWLDRLTPDAYEALAARHRAAPRALFVLGAEDCDRLTAALAGRPAPAERTASSAAPAIQGA